MPHGWRVVPGVGVVLLIAAVPLLYSSHRQTTFRNFRVVEDGVLYRSGQLDPDTFRRVLDEYGIRTVITLRTVRDSSRPFPDEWERELCAGRGKLLAMAERARLVARPRAAEELAAACMAQLAQKEAA